MWAGTETATEWMGYMNGAVQAGQRAANEVIQASSQTVRNDNTFTNSQNFYTATPTQGFYWTTATNNPFPTPPQFINSQTGGNSAQNSTNVINSFLNMATQFLKDLTDQLEANSNQNAGGR